MARTARSTWPRCLGSPISKVNRLTATRSRLVVTEADRMFTCWSDSARVTSDSSRVRSSASTWMATRNTESSVGRPAHVDQPLALESGRWARFTQSARCTDTPWPRVTKPMISSPGTGVQHRDSRTHTSGAPVDHDARVARSACGCGGWVGSVASARSSCAPSTPPTDLTSFSTTDWALTWPSPTAAYSAETSG